MLHIDANLDEDEYIKTIFHELVHCIQDINGLSDNNARECEAYKLEQLYYDNFMLTDAIKCPYSVSITKFFYVTNNIT